MRLLLQNVKEWQRETDDIKGYDVPGYEQKIWLRSNVADHATFRQCMVMKQYDFFPLPQTKRLMESYKAKIAANEPPLIIDCGANVGLASLWFAKVLPKATIIAVEPDDKNFSLLQRNTKHLGNQILSVKGGVWNQAANLNIVNPNAGAASFQLKPTTAITSNSIRAYTIDELCTMGGAMTPLIVKLDIEGSQAALFENNTEWVQRTHLITLELDDWLLPWAGTSRPFFKCLSQLPFDYLIHKESIFCFQDIT